MRDEWEGPVIWYFIIGMIMTPLLLALIVVAIMGFHIGQTTPLVIVTLTMYTAIALFIMLRHRELRELAHSQRRSTAMGFSDARQHLERALATSGQPATERAPTPGLKAAEWDVRGGITVKLFEGNDRCYIFVNPVNDSTRRDIEGLKRAIDAALARQAPSGDRLKGRQA